LADFTLKLYLLDLIAFWPIHRHLSSDIASLSGRDLVELVDRSPPNGRSVVSNSDSV
jgi:hypothetical protein